MSVKKLVSPLDLKFWCLTINKKDCNIIFQWIFIKEGLFSFGLGLEFSYSRDIFMALLSYKIERVINGG